MKKRIISCFLILLLMISCFNSEMVKASAVEANKLSKENNNSSYYSYSIKYENYKSANKIVYANIPSKGIVSKATETLDFKFEIPDDALYNIAIEYTACQTGLSPMERQLKINGEFPFEELKNISFERIFENETEIKPDSSGNDMIPSQKEVLMPFTKRINDVSGYYDMPYSFYLKKGSNTVSLIGVDGDFIITKLYLCPIEEIKTYKQVLREYNEKGYSLSKEAKDIRIEAETANLKSSYTLVPDSDRSSPLTKPYSPSKLKLNAIGGDSWSNPGLWMEWKVEVSKSALYRIDFRYRQNSAKGITVFRKLYIDGEIPFKEAAALEFNYDRSWNYSRSSQDYYYYLEEGTHTIRLEAVLSEMGEMLRQSENFSYNLNSLYREIITVTGTSPDIYRDYKISKRVVNLKERVSDLKKQSLTIISGIEKLVGGKNSVSVLLEAFTAQLAHIEKKPEKITTMLPDFKNNIISLGETLAEIRKTPLELDCILITSSDEELPSATGNIFTMLKHELIAFFCSFTEDYDSFSNSDNKGKTEIEVWMSSGREQANILKNIIDSNFNKDNIAVKLKLVQGALLQATIAGKAPDVALNIGQSDPVNYALRNAVLDLSKFPDYIEVANRFNPEALTPFTFDDGVYALPETESFYMLFYRKDILDELNITPPETWDEFYGILPILNRNNMEFGIPATINTFATLLYQNNGSFYLEDGTACTLDSQTALNIFSDWTELYTAYRLPVSFDFANRFRTGEMPMAIMDYTAFNTLSAFIPELRGYWDFCEIPGSYDQSSDSINRTTVNAVSGSIILADSNKQAEAWEFLKWWLSSEIQTSYATKTESVLGESSRYATANIESRQAIGWSRESLKKLNSQAEWVIGIPEIAGGYLATRHITNALNSVLNKGTIPSNTLNSYVQIINREITAKRKELGID